MRTTESALRGILRLNAASCLGFGAAAAQFSTTTAALLGSAPAWVVAATGLMLVINGVHLLVASFRRKLLVWEVLWFSFGDLAWWLGSLALIAAGVWVDAPGGIVVFAFIALGVALMGVMQIAHLAAMRAGTRPRDRFASVIPSWMNLPLWVRCWLIVLNAAFLAGAAFLPAEPGRATLIAYAASGPLLAAFIAHHGGLTRHLGIAHLVPWLPLLAWLGACLAAGAWEGPAAAYAAVLAAIVAVCLAFDIWDVWRWVRGERGLIGQPSA